MATRRQKRTDERWPVTLRMRVQVEKAIELTLTLLEQGERERPLLIARELWRQPCPWVDPTKNPNFGTEDGVGAPSATFQLGVLDDF